ncbi:MAG: hypothetical protein M1817_006720 [Caeruleum heppii]|nr:MAG: hypothetical protein M1817_006720 [Caeruleum heppii]
MGEEERPHKVQKLDDASSIAASIEPAQTPQTLEESPTRPLNPASSGEVQTEEHDSHDDRPQQDPPRNVPSSPQDLTNTTTTDPPTALSKNQQKKLKRKQEWEEGREYRKARRKEKEAEKKKRKRESAAVESPSSPTIQQPSPSQTPHVRSVQVPLTILLDCSFDALMTPKEIISLGSQLTRSYSETRNAPFRPHMVISSFGGRLKDRFETVLANHHRSWKGVVFTDDDFVEAATQATQRMSDPSSRDKLTGPLAHHHPTPSPSPSSQTIYLTSDSPHTLTHLSPHTTYIIGGLVDRNRHKGLCYRTACDRNIPTAKLPIGEYMKMNSRFVLATNHVVEIMLRWLEEGEWGRAFERVVPKRKGGVLRERTEGDGVGETKVVMDGGEEGEEIHGTESMEGKGSTHEDQDDEVASELQSHQINGDPIESTTTSAPVAVSTTPALITEAISEGIGEGLH